MRYRQKDIADTDTDDVGVKENEFNILLYALEILNARGIHTNTFMYVLWYIYVFEYDVVMAFLVFGLFHLNCVYVWLSTSLALFVMCAARVYSGREKCHSDRATATIVDNGRQRMKL